MDLGEAVQGVHALVLFYQAVDRRLGGFKPGLNYCGILPSNGHNKD